MQEILGSVTMRKRLIFKANHTNYTDNEIIKREENKMKYYTDSWL